MTPERFAQIEELFHAAREANVEERANLLAQTDAALRHEVESLLAQRPDSKFLDRPALVNAPGLLPPSTSERLSAGVYLGPYCIESKIGEGGMGEVFRATDTRLGRAVAIKTTEHFSVRFEREARAIAALNHPNICTLHDVGPNYLVMELIEGETLAAQLKRGPLSIETTILYASQILAALMEAHSKGVIHRDLKPANIMIAKSGVKVLDFGLAKSDQDEGVTLLSMGTPGYVSPEQKDGKPADARSDIFSFGCVLYEMVTGTPTGARRKRLPSARLERIISRCQEEEPGRRWKSAAEVQQELSKNLKARSHWAIASASAVGLAILAALYFSFHSAPKLTDKDTLVLADFVNNTGEPVFDGTLREGLAIQLEQSPFLKIMDDEQVERVLGLMSLPRGSRITNATAHEICVREGAAAMIDGRIANLGTSYVITLAARGCQDGATLARYQMQVRDKEGVLNALSTGATAIRRNLGESLNSIRKLNRPLEQATTASLEALQNYTSARSEIDQGHFLEAIPLFERAIAMDPKFAMAFYQLAVTSVNAGDMRGGRENSKRAFSLIARVSEYERAEIAAYYYLEAGELDRAIDAYQSAIRSYPRTWEFHNELSMTYIDLGRYEEGLKEALEAVRLQNNVEPPYRRLLDAYMCLDQFDEAKRWIKRVRAIGIDGSRLHQRFLAIALAEEDEATIATEVQWFAGKPEEYIGFELQAVSEAIHGHQKESHILHQRAEQIARQHELTNVASKIADDDATAEALSGRCEAGHKLGWPPMALALCGDADRAEKIAAEISRASPNGTLWNAVELPEIRATIALHRNQASRSLDLLSAALPYERAHLGASYLRGLSYLRLHKGLEAAAEFEKVVNHRGANWRNRSDIFNRLLYSRSHLGMAHGYALAGETSKARRAFENFFELWKDADSGVPILKQAKAEYARLP